MIAAIHNIILFNKRLDTETRRDVFVATFISGVSVYSNKQSTTDKNFHETTEKYKIRIPITAKVQSNKVYLPELRYDKLTSAETKEYWTLHTEDFIVVCSSDDIKNPVFDSAVTQQQAEEIAKSYGIFNNLIYIVDYSDNTLRGSKRTKHWRIGGA